MMTVLAPLKDRRQLLKLARRVLIGVAVLAVIAAIGYAFMPPIVLADLETVTQGPLEVTVREEGRTRIRERYVVSSPLAGRVLRIELDPGDAVHPDESVLAVIEPADPSLLDARALVQAQAKVQANEAARLRAEADLKRAAAALERAQSRLKRVRSLSETRSASEDELEDAQMQLTTSTEEYAAAKFNVDIAEFELEQAKAALLRFQPEENESSPGELAPYRLEVRAPIDGRILRVFQESSSVVTPGTPLMEIGDPTDLEIEVDLLSEDAVRVNVGNPVRIEQWGGGKSLAGKVRLIEPKGFTKISALGVEEQRVNVIIDFTSPVAERTNLGDSYRVETDIIIWESENVVQVPVSCLFRQESQWAVFVVADRHAHRRAVEIGERNNIMAEVKAGLKPGETVIVHPSDQIADGTVVEPRM